MAATTLSLNDDPTRFRCYACQAVLDLPKEQRVMVVRMPAWVYRGLIADAGRRGMYPATLCRQVLETHVAELRAQLRRADDPGSAFV